MEYISSLDKNIKHFTVMEYSFRLRLSNTQTYNDELSAIGRGLACLKLTRVCLVEIRWRILYSVTNVNNLLFSCYFTKHM